MRNATEFTEPTGRDDHPEEPHTNGHHAEAPTWLPAKLPASADRRTDVTDRTVSRGLTDLKEAAAKQEEAIRAVAAATQFVNAALHGDQGLVSRVNQQTQVLERIAGAMDVIAFPFRVALRIARLPRRVLGRLRRRRPAPAAAPQATPAPAATPADAATPKPETFLGELIAGRWVEQPFVCPVDHLSSLRIQFDTFDRQNYCTVTMTLLDAAGAALREVTIPAPRLRNHGFQSFGFEPLAGVQGKPLRVRLTSKDAVPGVAVSPKVRPTPASGLTVDGHAHLGTLLFSPCGVDNDPALAAGARDILVFTPDRIGKMRIGLGMRHWEIARALTARGLSVTLATPHPLPPGMAGDGFALHHAAADEVVPLARRHRCVLIQGNVLDQFPDLADAGVPIAVDLICPMHLENLEKSEAEFEHARRLMVESVARGDFFVCGNERQRLHWLGMMTALGRVGKQARLGSPDLRRLIDVVPFGLSDAPPVKTKPVLKGALPGIHPGDFVCMWFGGIWDWMDPAPIVRAVGAAWGQDPRVKLFFSAYSTPDGHVHAMARRTRELAERLGLLDRCVFFNEFPVPFDERADYLLETDLGILCQAPNIETQVSARTRVLDYLWADCPLMMNEGDEWADTIRERRLGVILTEASEDHWREAILRLVRNPDELAGLKANIAAYKGGLLWTRCVEPLYQFAMRQRSVRA